jgi:hypothetical protein
MISKEQWATIEKHFSERVFHTEKFQLGETLLSVSKTFVEKNKLGLVVYIDGVIQPSQGIQSSSLFNPLTSQVWCKRTKHLYSPAKKQKLINEYGKRRIKQYFPDLDKTYSYFSPLFTSEKTLIRQFKKLDGLSVVAESE